VSPVNGEIAIAEWKTPYDALAPTEAPVDDRPAAAAPPAAGPVTAEKPRQVEPVHPPDDPGLEDDVAGGRAR
jgi:uncharacterized membrane-anchored protein